MTTYNAILATETDPDAPLRSSLFKRMVANPIASFEGAMGAPRLHYSAMDRLRAGDEIRWTRAPVQTVSGAPFTLFTGSTWQFLQAGTIRIRFNHWRNTNSSEVRVVRVRSNSTPVVLTTVTSTAGSAPGTAQVYDCDVQPGDIVYLEHRNPGGANSNLQDVTLGVLNATDFLIPAGFDMFGRMTNPTITSP